MIQDAKYPIKYIDKVYTIEELKELLTPLFKQYPVHKAILYGSYARGEATPTSDVDIVIDTRNQLKGFSWCGVMADAEEVLFKYVDAHEHSRLKSNSVVLKAMQTEGVMLYER